MTEKCERDRREQLEQHQRRAEDTINQLKIQFSRQEEQWSNQLADREKKLTNCRRAKEELEKRYKRELAVSIASLVYITYSAINACLGGGN